MTTFTVGKPSPNKSDTKNASIAMKSRQQVINEVNKKRTLLQDNSWIKKRPEEETADENYGRVVLNQYKSQDGLHRTADEKGDQKALLSRYRSDTTLDRIPGKNDADKANKFPTLDGKPSSRKELDGSINTGNATSPVKKKRQSWMPPPVSSQKVTIDEEQHKRHSWASQNITPAVTINSKPVSTTSNKGGGLKMTVYSSEPITSPRPNVAVSDPARTRQICPAKPSESDAKKTMTREKTGRGQELDDLIDVKTKGNKSNQGSQDLDILIQVKTKSDKRHQDLDDFIKVNRISNEHAKGERDIDDLIAVNNTTQKNKRSQELDDLIVVKPSPVDQSKKRAPEQDHKSASIPGGPSERNHLYQDTRGSSSFPRDAYEDSIPGKSIKTVYSTSDRAIIEKEMCTYCRKPLGTDTKMILDALQICCHATCFKCEICKAPLENVKAGDSIWIYKNTVHCAPCYSRVKASWAY